MPYKKPQKKHAGGQLQPARSGPSSRHQPPQKKYPESTGGTPFQRPPNLERPRRSTGMPNPVTGSPRRVQRRGAVRDLDKGSSTDLSHLPRGWKGPPLSREDYKKHKYKQTQNRLQQHIRGRPLPVKSIEEQRKLVSDPYRGPRLKKWKEQQKPKVQYNPSSPTRVRYNPSSPTSGLWDVAGSRPRPYGNRKSGGTVSAKKYSMNRGGKVASLRKPTRA